MADDAPQTPHTPPPAADPQSIEGLFLQALGQSPEQRQAFLDEACGDDAERRRRIEALLRAYEDAGSFLEKPPAGVDSSATVSLEFLAPSSDPGLLGMLGHYEVYEMLGRGGMGIVFRARDPKLNRVVAIKVLAPELAANPNARRRFLREAKTAASISHPHVVTIHAVDEGSSADERNPASSGSRVSSLPFLVMECIVGQTLQQKLDKQGSLRLTEILRIGHQAAQGLAAAHRQGLIHRDIKPANILLENGVERVKITDFGLARAADDASITRTGEVSGTPQYMSPEQASGGTIDHRSDLFSLGCVLYAMCTGRSPFRATTLAAAIRRVCDDTPRPIEEINPEAPQWLIEIVNRLLAKDPDERIQSADEVAELLGDHLAGIQHPPRARSTESPRPRAVAALPQSTPASVAKTAHGLGMQVPLRLLLWLGAIALLFPIFFALIGTAIGAGGDALEGAVVAAVICWPIALVAFAVALLDRSLQGNPVANAVFLLVCILLGPIGILLYLVRRDQYLMTDRPTADSSPPRHAVSQQPPEKGESREVPQWLLTPLPGPVKVIAFLLFAAACLVLGQAIEQWSDVSQEVGISLYAATIPLAVLAIQCAVGAGVQFRWPQVATLGLLGLVLAFLGAQAPDREFKQGLKSEADMVAIFTAVLYLVAIPISLLLWGLSQYGEEGRARRDWLGSTLIWIGATIWGSLVAWMMLVAVGAVPPPPFAARSWVEVPILVAVMLGGLLVGAGMLLRRYIATPGMVRQFAVGKDVRSSDAGSPSAAVMPADTSAAISPWRVLGWMLIAGLVIVPGCLAVMLGVPMLSQARSDIGVVQIDFDNARPISWVVARGDIGAARAEQRIIDQPVTSNPLRLPLPAGVYDLTMTYQADGTTGQFVQRVQVEPGQTKTLDVRQKIAVAHQLQHLDKSQVEDDGYAPPRTIPLGEEGRSTGGGTAGMEEGFGTSGEMAGVPEGAVLLSVADPGLSVVFDRIEGEGEMDAFAGGDFMGESGMFGGMAGSGGDMMGMGGAMGASSSGTVRLPEGMYRVLVTDQLAGWGRATHSPGFGMGMAAGSMGPQLPSSELPERLQVVAGEFQKLTVARDLKRVADLQPDWQQRGFFAFRWNGETFDLTQKQAVVVQRLLEASLTETPAVHEALLLAPAEMSAETRKLEPVTLSLEEAQQQLEESEQQTLKSLFNDGQHPAWGTLIIEGEEAETYRLSQLRTGDPAAEDTPQVRVDVTIADAGLRVALEEFLGDMTQLHGTLMQGSILSPKGTFLDKSGAISVKPGTYQVIVEDELAGWMAKTEEGEPGPVRYLYGLLAVEPDKPDAREVSRSFHKMAAAFPRAINRGTHFFRWQGETYKLNGQQAPIVAFLLKAYADGEPDLHEARLLSGGTFQGREIDLLPIRHPAEEELKTLRDKGQSLKGLFNDGEHSAWGTLIVEGEGPNTYRLAELDQGRDIAKPSSADAGSPARQSPPPAVVGSIAPGPGERAAQLSIDIQNDGFTVAVRRMSVFDDAVVGSEQVFTDVGATHLWVAPGKYELLIRDQLFGWKQDRTSSLTIDADESQTFTIKRDLAEYAEGAAPKKWTFLWDGREYRLPSGGRWPASHAEGMAIQKLLAAYVAGAPDVPAGELLTAWKKTEPDLYERYRNVAEAQTPEELFQVEYAEGSQSHPWGRLIVPGETEGTYRLAPLDRGTIEVTKFAPGMVVTVARIGPDPRSSRRELFKDVSLEVPPGEYRYVVGDDFVGWGRWQPNASSPGFGPNENHVRSGTIAVASGESISFTADRRWADYIDPPEPTESSRWVPFMWFPKYEPHHNRPHVWGVRVSTGSPDNGIDNFDVPQFRVLRELLRAFADGQPGVAEDELLRRAGVEAESWDDVFPADAGGYGGRWQTIIVPGETERTWRLKPPPEQQSE